MSSRARVTLKPIAEARVAVCVTLNPYTVEALSELAAREDLPKGRIVDRAIAAYEALLDERDAGGDQ